MVAATAVSRRIAGDNVYHICARVLVADAAAAESQIITENTVMTLMMPPSVQNSAAVLAVCIPLLRVSKDAHRHSAAYPEDPEETQEERVTASRSGPDRQRQVVA